jgi:uncharacterized protein with NAD-binding domain and iron-sulfur cluster
MVGEQRPVEVAVIGGGCASTAAAFELTRPEHHGKYHVTVYQLGWRLGGKGASGRGPADRIEEHGFHVWLGFYENAFRLLRECYAELKRDPRTCRIADWQDAVVPDPFIGVVDRSHTGAWQQWMGYFPPDEGLPGDPLTTHNPFSIPSYLVRTTRLLRTLLAACQTRQHPSDQPQTQQTDGSLWSFLGNLGQTWPPSPTTIMEGVTRGLKYGLLATMGGLIHGIGLLEARFATFTDYPENLIRRLLDAIADSARQQLHVLADSDDEIRRLWEVIDLVLAIMVGTVRCGLITDPRGFDAINDDECREWLRSHGASERSLHSALVRGLYDLAFAYEDGDFQKPRLAAGQALRGSLRMFFTYRGALFWKMQAGMGDVVFAPFYEVLQRRGVSFKFFHRLENVKLADQSALAPGESLHIESLTFDVQAEIKNGGEYQPLSDVRGLPCWPAQPDYSQLVDGERFVREGWAFESFWDQRKITTKTLQVSRDFDFVVLGLGVGAIPYVCKDILARDARWRSMVAHVKTAATQAFQIWLREDMANLGWHGSSVSLSGFVQPFDTWADMRQLITEERWPTQPGAISYFCCVLPDPPLPQERTDTTYPARRRDEVRHNAIHFLNHDIPHLWPHATRRPGEFRWDVLLDPHEQPPSHEDAGASDHREKLSRTTT